MHGGKVNNNTNYPVCYICDCTCKDEICLRSHICSHKFF